MALSPKEKKWAFGIGIGFVLFVVWKKMTALPSTETVEKVITPSGSLSQADADKLASEATDNSKKIASYAKRKMRLAAGQPHPAKKYRDRNDEIKKMLSDSGYELVNTNKMIGGGSNNYKAVKKT